MWIVPISAKGFEFPERGLKAEYGKNRFIVVTYIYEVTVNFRDILNFKKIVHNQS
jgi:hypothetical protein